MTNQPLECLLKIPTFILAHLVAALKKRKTFIFYSIIGVSGATIDYISFFLMVKWLPIHYLIINVISSCIAITNNFFINARLNFGVKDMMIRRFLSFYAVGIVGVAITSALLYIMIDLMNFIPEISKFIALFLIVTLQYNLNKRYSFRRLHHT